MLTGLAVHDAIKGDILGVLFLTGIAVLFIPFTKGGKDDSVEQER